MRRLATATVIVVLTLGCVLAVGVSAAAFSVAVTTYAEQH